MCFLRSSICFLLTNSDVVIVQSVGERLQTYMVGDTDILGWFWK